LPPDLAVRLEDAAMMRNVIVHQYQRTDFNVLHDSIAPALRDFGQLLMLLEARLDELGQTGKP
jgi:uncharacterized protein YutE (UPF0331/DUF86 family)